MKTAVSALLDEIFDAEKLVYDDCPHWQMQCPVCHEAVFKVERNAAGKELHYFSHYRKDKLLNEECELRVGAMTAEEVEKHNAAARGQTLTYYLSVLKKEILRAYDEKALAGERKQLQHSAGARRLTRDVVYLVQHRHHFCNIAHMAQIAPIKEQSFSARRQEDIADNVLAHLASATGRENLQLLIELAIVDILAARKDIAQSDILRGPVFDVVFSGKRRGMEAIERLQSSCASVGDIRDFSAWDGICNAIVFIVFNKLLNIDYWRLLKDQRALQTAGGRA